MRDGPLDTFNDRNKIVLGKIAEAWHNRRHEIRVGDFVRFPTGALHRFTYDWGNEIQTAPSGRGSFYIGTEGFCDYSGSLEPSIPKSRIVPDVPPLNRKGDFWTFDEGVPGADRGKTLHLDCNYWRLT